MPGDARLDPSLLRAAIADVDQAMSQARHGATTIPAAVIAIRHALTRLLASVGQSDQADQLLREVVAGLQQGDPTFCARATTIFIQLGGQPT